MRFRQSLEHLVPTKMLFSAKKRCVLTLFTSLACKTDYTTCMPLAKLGERLFPTATTPVSLVE